MNDSHKQKLAKALEYLDERKINIMKHNFRPTSIAHTDVSQTIARYRQQTQGVNLIRRAK